MPVAIMLRFSVKEHPALLTSSVNFAPERNSRDSAVLDEGIAQGVISEERSAVDRLLYPG
jgi:hypothetical protein